MGGYRKIRTERGSTQIYLPEGISKVFIKEDWLKNEEQLAGLELEKSEFSREKEEHIQKEG